MAEHDSRDPHAVLDLPSRRLKAIKIERLLGLEGRPGPLRMLEIGTGSGGIAHYFATQTNGRYVVDAVDVVDNRLVSEGYAFSLVQDTRLPFADASFDVVLSNHVIEHVGDEAAQRAHLAEIGRVLRPEGLGYLAVPNRWMLVEPHFRLAFLSWLPEFLRSPYVRLAGRGTHYDCRPLTAGRAARLLRGAGFAPRQQCGSALLMTFELERPRSPLYRGLLRWLPDWLYRALGPIFPTLIYVLPARRAG
jgi:SAM-dependent methyltransferase